MKDISQLSDCLTEMGNVLQKHLIEAQSKAADIMLDDVLQNANYDTGTYKNSIYRTETEFVGNDIQTFIGSDMQVVTKDGKSYNLGALLEHGTDPHAIPNAFGWGDIYGYDSSQYKRTLQDDWHPGMVAHNTYHNARINHQLEYQQLLIEGAANAFKEVFK